MSPMTCFAPAFSPDGKYLALGQSRLVRVVDAATGREAFTCNYGEGRLTRAIFSPDGKSLAACGELGASIWDVATHQKRLTCQSTARISYGLAYSPDSKQLAMSSIEGLIEQWDASTGEKTGMFKRSWLPYLCQGGSARRDSTRASPGASVP